MSSGNDKKDTRFNFRVETEILEKYKKAVGGNASEDLRKYMIRRVQNTPLSELKQKRIEKINQINLLKIELEELDNEIKEAEEKRERNNQNKELKVYCMEIIENIISNNPNNAISRERIEKIANNKNLEPAILIKACKEKGIEFASENKVSSNSRLVESKEIEKSPNELLLKIISRGYKQPKNRGISIEKFIEKNEDKYIQMADKEQANYDEVKEKVLAIFSKPN